MRYAREWRHKVALQDGVRRWRKNVERVYARHIKNTKCITRRWHKKVAQEGGTRRWRKKVAQEGAARRWREFILHI